MDAHVVYVEHLADYIGSLHGEDVDGVEYFVEPSDAVMAVPILYGGVVLAVLYAGGPAAKGYDPRSLAIVQELSEFAAPLVAATMRSAEVELMSREDERHRIVHHLHDTTLQLLFNISLSSQRLRAELGDAALSSDVLGILESIQVDARDASECLRNTFRDNTPSDRGLVAAVRELTRAFASRTMIPAEVTTLGAPRPCDDSVERLVFGAAREALHNIEKHAHASSVIVCVVFGAEDITLMVQDDGVGFAAAPDTHPSFAAGSGLGLSGMDRDAAVLGGRVHWSNNEDGGATMRVTVPIQQVA